jgi:hypothetical protein
MVKSEGSRGGRGHVESLCVYAALGPRSWYVSRAGDSFLLQIIKRM